MIETYEQTIGFQVQQVLCIDVSLVSSALHFHCGVRRKQ